MLNSVGVIVTRHFLCAHLTGGFISVLFLFYFIFFLSQSISNVTFKHRGLKLSRYIASRISLNRVVGFRDISVASFSFRPEKDASDCVSIKNLKKKLFGKKKRTRPHFGVRVVGYVCTPLLSFWIFIDITLFFLSGGRLLLAAPLNRHGHFLFSASIICVNVGNYRLAMPNSFGGGWPLSCNFF